MIEAIPLPQKCSLKALDGLSLYWGGGKGVEEKDIDRLKQFCSI